MKKIVLIILIVLLTIALCHFYKKEKFINNVELGDYIKLIPTNTSYTINKELTGYTIEQKINPSELNLWRVIRKNADGTVEVVSEYVSKEKIYFSGKIGYINYIKVLNEIVESYTNEKYVIKTRHMGYNNQTEKISSNIDNLNWKESTINNTNEKNGGGDILYEHDYNLVKEVLKTARGTNVNKEENSYWISSRYYNFDNNNYSFNGRIIDEKGIINETELVTFDSKIGLNNQLSGYSIRPMLILKKGIQIRSGNGKSESTAYTLK